MTSSDLLLLAFLVIPVAACIGYGASSLALRRHARLWQWALVCLAVGLVSGLAVLLLWPAGKYSVGFASVGGAACAHRA